MATYNGTNGNDTRQGELLEDNLFRGFGVGADRLQGGAYRDVFELTADRFFDTINGGDGFDHVDYSATGSAVTVTLGDGSTTGLVTSNVFMGTYALVNGVFVPQFQTRTVAALQNIEEVTGSRFNDQLTGNNGQNVLRGGIGNDTLDGQEGDDKLFGGEGGDTLIGGEGSDTVEYGDSDGGVTVNLDNGFGWLAYAQGDTYDGIENVRGSHYDDFIVGDDGGNRLSGGGGRDIIDGGGGRNIIHGDGGDDNLSGGSDRDQIFGDTGNDTIRGFGGGDRLDGGDDDDLFIVAAGGDDIDGGDGIDTLSFLGDPVPDGGVTADMRSGIATFVDGSTSRFENIENLRGSNFDDILFGDDGDNFIQSHGGSDTINGGGGNDVLAGGLYESDAFIFGDPTVSQPFGKDIVLDFEVGLDRYRIANSGQPIEYSQVGADTLITVGTMGSITLLNVEMNLLLA